MKRLGMIVALLVGLVFASANTADAHWGRYRYWGGYPGYNYSYRYHYGYPYGYHYSYSYSYPRYYGYYPYSYGYSPYYYSYRPYYGGFYFRW
jgi:hypothetical protein